MMTSSSATEWAPIRPIAASAPKESRTPPGELPYGPCADLHMRGKSRAACSYTPARPLSFRCHIPCGETHRPGCHTANSHKIRAAHKQASLWPRDRRPGRRERSLGVRQSLDRAPCGSDRGIQRWEHQEPYEDPTPRMGTMEDRETADCPIDTTHLCTIQENICTL